MRAGLNGPGHEGEGFEKTFESYWESRKWNYVKKDTAVYLFDVETFKHTDTNKLLGWIDTYKDWIDFDALDKLGLTSNHDVVEGFKEAYDRLKLAGGESDQPKFKIDLHVHYGNLTIEFGGSKQVDALRSYTDFASWYETFIDKLFDDVREISDPANKLAEFIKRMNVQHYFHLLPDVQGRTYDLFLQFFSLTNNLPLHPFEKASPADYVKTIEGAESLRDRLLDDLRVFYSNIEDDLPKEEDVERSAEDGDVGSSSDEEYGLNSPDDEDGLSLFDEDDAWGSSDDEGGLSLSDEEDAWGSSERQGDDIDQLPVEDAPILQRYASPSNVDYSLPLNSETDDFYENYYIDESNNLLEKTEEWESFAPNSDAWEFVGDAPEGVTKGRQILQIDRDDGVTNVREQRDVQQGLPGGTRDVALEEGKEIEKYYVFASDNETLLLSTETEDGSTKFKISEQDILLNADEATEFLYNTDWTTGKELIGSGFIALYHGLGDERMAALLRSFSPAQLQELFADNPASFYFVKNIGIDNFANLLGSSLNQGDDIAKERLLEVLEGIGDKDALKAVIEELPDDRAADFIRSIGLDTTHDLLGEDFAGELIENAGAFTVRLPDNWDVLSEGDKVTWVDDNIGKLDSGAQDFWTRAKQLLQPDELARTLGDLAKGAASGIVIGSVEDIHDLFKYVTTQNSTQLAGAADELLLPKSQIARLAKEGLDVTNPTIVREAADLLRKGVGVDDAAKILKVFSKSSKFLKFAGPAGLVASIIVDLGLGIKNLVDVIKNGGEPMDYVKAALSMVGLDLAIDLFTAGGNFLGDVIEKGPVGIINGIIYDRRDDAPAGAVYKSAEDIFTEFYSQAEWDAIEAELAPKKPGENGDWNGDQWNWYEGMEPVLQVLVRTSNGVEEYNTANANSRFFGQWQPLTLFEPDASSVGGMRYANAGYASIESVYVAGFKQTEEQQSVGEQQQQPEGESKTPQMIAQEALDQYNVFNFSEDQSVVFTSEGIDEGLDAIVAGIRERGESAQLKLIGDDGRESLLTYSVETDSFIFFDPENYTYANGDAVFQAKNTAQDYGRVQIESDFDLGAYSSSGIENDITEILHENMREISQELYNEWPESRKEGDYQYFYKWDDEFNSFAGPRYSDQRDGIIHAVLQQIAEDGLDIDSDMGRINDIIESHLAPFFEDTATAYIDEIEQLPIPLTYNPEGDDAFLPLVSLRGEGYVTSGGDGLIFGTGTGADLLQLNPPPRPIPHGEYYVRDDGIVLAKNDTGLWKEVDASNDNYDEVDRGIIFYDDGSGYGPDLSVSYAEDHLASEAVVLAMLHNQDASLDTLIEIVESDWPKTSPTVASAIVANKEIPIYLKEFIFNQDLLLGVELESVPINIDGQWVDVSSIYTDTSTGKQYAVDNNGNINSVDEEDEPTLLQALSKALPVTELSHPPYVDVIDISGIKGGDTDTSRKIQIQHAVLLEDGPYAGQLVDARSFQFNFPSPINNDTLVEVPGIGTASMEALASALERDPQELLIEYQNRKDINTSHSGYLRQALPDLWALIDAGNEPHGSLTSAGGVAPGAAARLYLETHAIASLPETTGMTSPEAYVEIEPGIWREVAVSYNYGGDIKVLPEGKAYYSDGSGTGPDPSKPYCPVPTASEVIVNHFLDDPNTDPEILLDIALSEWSLYPDVQNRLIQHQNAPESVGENIKESESDYSSNHSFDGNFDVLLQDLLGGRV